MTLENLSMSLCILALLISLLFLFRLYPNASDAGSQTMLYPAKSVLAFMNRNTGILKCREAACSALAVRATQRRALYGVCGAVAAQRRRRARKAAASAHAELCRQQRCLRAWRRAAWAGRRVAALAVLQAVRVQGTVLGAWREVTLRSRCAGYCMHVRASFMLLMYKASSCTLFVFSDSDFTHVIRDESSLFV